jgi:hypothetical protein
MSPDEAGGVLWVLASPDVHRLYRGDCGWMAEQYTAWLTSAVLDALLDPDSRGAPK